MTADELINLPWSGMTEYPSQRRPRRSQLIVERDVANENGVIYNARVETNRKRKRYWLTVSNAGWMRVYLTTVSTKHVNEWITALGGIEVAK